MELPLALADGQPEATLEGMRAQKAEAPIQGARVDFRFDPRQGRPFRIGYLDPCCLSLDMTETRRQQSTARANGFQLLPRYHLEVVRGESFK